MAEAVKEEKIIGNGLSKKQAKKIRMATMSKKEIAYLRRKALIEKVYGSALVPFINRFPQDTKLYQLMTTRPGEGKFARGRD